MILFKNFWFPMTIKIDKFIEFVHLFALNDANMIGEY